MNLCYGSGRHLSVSYQVSDRAVITFLIKLVLSGQFALMLGHMCGPTKARAEIGPGLKADAG